MGGRYKLGAKSMKNAPRDPMCLFAWEDREGDHYCSLIWRHGDVHTCECGAIWPERVVAKK